jgi:hypothetical protein
MPTFAPFGLAFSRRTRAEARRRAITEGLKNVEFLRADAQVHAFETSTFDLVISRLGVMFFADRTAAFANIASTLGSPTTSCSTCCPPSMQRDIALAPGACSEDSAN